MLGKYKIKVLGILFTISSILIVKEVVGQAASATWVLTSNGNPTTVGNVTATTIAKGTSVSALVYTGCGVASTGYTTAAAEKTTAYYQYSITPAAGYNLTVTAINGYFIAWSSTGSQCCNEPDNYSIWYSTNGFTTYTNLTGTNVDGTDGDCVTPENITGLNISVPNGTTLTVRTYLYACANSTDAFYNHNIVISGTTVAACSNPSITSQPSTAAQTVCLNAAPTNLSVTATGTTLTYQWYSNAANSNSGGTLIAGATSSTYTPVTSSAGTLYYYCIVYSQGGCPVTTNVSGSVTVNALPAAVTVSSAGTYCGSTTLTASGGAGGTMYWENTTSGGTSTATPSSSQSVSSTSTYYYGSESVAGCWTYGSAAVTINANPGAVTVSTAGTYCTSTSLVATGGAGGTIYWENTTSGGTSTVLGTTPQTVTTTGTYYFGSDNAGCWTYGSAAVTINTPITITVQPSTTIQNLCSGISAATLSVTATGTSPTYQWYSNVANSNVGGTSIGGATSSSYTPPTSTAGTTYYYCVVSGSAPCGSVTSNVSGAVNVTATPAAVTVSTAGTYCTSTSLVATGGAGGTIYWENTTSGGTSTVLGTTPQTVTSTGTYYFGSDNAGCWTYGSAAVTINLHPSITVQPSTATQSVCQNSAVTALSVTATGAGLTYQWYSNAANSNVGGTLLVGATSNSYTPVTSAVGVLYYYCIVSGTCAPAATSNVSGSVTVNAAPTITSQPSNTTVCTSIGANFTVATSAGASTYQWQASANGSTGWANVVNGTPAGVTYANGTTATLTATGTAATTYYYLCVVSALGCTTNSNSATLTINAVPATPGAITGTTQQCQGTSGQTYSISAVAGATSYTWAVPTGWTITAGGTGTFITVTAGSAGQNGNITVTANNACGSSSSSSLAVTVIATPATPGSITGTTAQCASTTGQTYSISAVTYATTYTWTVPTGWTITAGSGTTSITVTTGTSGQNGNITVTAGNGCGTSASSSLAVTSTNCIPPTPTSSAATNADCGSFFANWSSSTGATTYYIDVSTSNTFASFVTGYNNYNAGLCTSYFVSGLSASTTYYYRVRAANGFGSSASSAVQSVTTTAACSGNLATWQKVGAGAGGGINNGDSSTIGAGDFEVAAEVADNTDNVLFIGGFFNQLGNSSALPADCIGEWTPSTTYPYTSGTWSNIGSIAGGLLVTNGAQQSNQSEIYAMAYFNGILYIGGNFTTINGSSTDGSGKSYNNLAKYTIATSTWSAVGGGGVTGGSGVGRAVMYAQGPIGGGGFYVQSLAVDNNGDLYVGGNFTSVAGSGGYNNIAMWNGTTWSNLGGGMTGTNSKGGGTGTTAPTVYALDVVDLTHVYAGGQFTTAGATGASNIAMWNGSSWSALGAGIPQTAYYGLPCGGSVSGNPSWCSCPVVAALANNGTLVYAGGAFSKAGTVTAENIAQWNQGTSTWADIGGAGGPSNDVGEVVALTVSGGILYVGGDFQEVNSCGLTVNNIAEYDGWAAMPSTRPGFNPGLSNVLSVAVLSGFATAGYGIVYAGGDFEAGTDATGHPTVNHIAQYAGAASGPSVLPISLLSFDAQYNGNSSAVDVTWSTASEVNNKEFTIEKSMDGISWEFVANVPGAGNSTRVINYASVDESPFGGISYYRLKQTDYDGNHTYSDIRAVEINGSFNKMEVVPNPAKNHTNILFGTSEPGVAMVSVYDCAGRLISTTQVNTIKGINTTELDISGYNNGVYFVTVNGELQQYTAKFVVIR